MLLLRLKSKHWSSPQKRFLIWHIHKNKYKEKNIFYALHTPLTYNISAFYTPKLLFVILHTNYISKSNLFNKITIFIFVKMFPSKIYGVKMLFHETKNYYQFKLTKLF